MFACEKILEGPQNETKLVRVPITLATKSKTGEFLIYVKTLTGKTLELFVKALDSI